MKKRFFILLIFSLSLTVFGVAVEEWKWGFDGTITETHINPLSVMISNPMPVPFDGMIELQKINHMGSSIGAPLLKKIFLAPYATRWVQFYPYVRSSQEDWRLSWGKRPNQNTVIKVSSAKGRAYVMLVSEGPLLSKGRVRLPFFRENLFPPTVAATDGLAGVVINKIPEFTPLQRRAFHDWLYAGGKVYIIESDGRFPDFGSDYSYLDFRGNRAEVGAGEVIKYSGNKILTSADLGAAGKIKVAENQIYMQDVEDSFFRKLRSQLKTNHNWILIFLISIVYGLMVTVVNFIIGRKSKKAWKPILFFLSMVIIFSLLLAWCGRRGYGEKSQILALTYAKELEPGHFALSQWMDIFVTDGDYYKITHKDRNNIYADCQTNNSLNAEIYNGKDGVFLVDIPLFSSMQLFHRTDAYTSKPLNVKATSASNGDFTSISVELSEDFPRPVLEVIAVVNGKVYPLSSGKLWNKFQCKSISNPDDVSKYIRDWNNSGGFYNFYSSDEKPEKVFKSMIAPLIIRSRGGDKVIDDYYPTSAATDNKMDIYVMTSTPDGFKTKGDIFKNEKGYTLFHFVR
jgi:hypothetical protein